MVTTIAPERWAEIESWLHDMRLLGPGRQLENAPELNRLFAEVWASRPDQATFARLFHGILLTATMLWIVGQERSNGSDG